MNIDCWDRRIKRVRNSSTSIQETIINPSDFTGIIEPAGCFQDVSSQENHILFATVGTTTPKNIAFRTQGDTGPIYGSFFRDDTLTFPKGTPRGSGANDLSVFRTDCSQVALGDFSSILGGINQQVGGINSSIVSGSSNVVSGSDSVILGGLEQYNNSETSGIMSGYQNDISGSTGSWIGNGNNNMIIDSSYSSILNGNNNTIIISSNSAILNGISNNLSGDNSFIGVGISGTNNSTNSVLVSGIGNTINGGTNNLISTGENNFINNLSDSGIFTGKSNNITASAAIIIAGQNNTLNGNNSLIGTGISNTNNGSVSAIVSGELNSLLGTNNFIGSGISNNITSNAIQNSGILGGSNNLFSNNVVRSIIIGGNGNRITAGLTNSFIGVGTSNTNNAEASAIVSGELNSLLGTNNFIGSGISNNITNNAIQNSGILGGSNNLFSNNVVRSIIIGGNGNRITAGLTNSFIDCGTSNTNNGNSSGVISGVRNLIAGGTNNLIGGFSNTIQTSSTNDAILNGSNNLTSTNPNSNNIMIGGNGNVIGAISNSFIGCGATCTNSGQSSGIVSGVLNSVAGTHQFIGTGFSNRIPTSSANDAILNGSNNLTSINPNSNNIMIGGNGNVIGAISNSFIGCGATCANSGQSSGIVSGVLNSVAGTNQFIGTGFSNRIQISSANDAILNGSNNSTSTNPNSNNIILGGNGNVIGAIANSFIGCGATCTNSGQSSGIVSGVLNSVAGTNQFIGTGFSNRIQISSANDAILNGSNNSTSTNPNSNNIILGGNGNVIGAIANSFIGCGATCTNSGQSSGIVSGVLNSVAGTNQFIGTGFSNLLTAANCNNCILNGRNNTFPLTPTLNSTIIGGFSNTINVANPNNLIGCGSFNINTGTNSAITTGVSNSIGAGTNLCWIATGFSNLISTSANNASCILDGSGNRLTGTSTRSIIIGSGWANSITASNSMIGTGFSNVNNSIQSAIITGNFNSLIGASSNNFIGSGISNSTTRSNTNHSAILNGRLNSFTNPASTTISRSAILSGQINTLTSTTADTFIGSGSNNTSFGNSNAIFCGEANSNRMTNSLVACGLSNSMTGAFSNCFTAGQGLSLSTQSFSAAFGRFNTDGVLGGANRIFMVGGGTGSAFRRNLFSVNLNGNAYGTQFVNGGADFAEFFESYKGLEKINIGESVCMIDQRFLGKIITSQITFESSPSGFMEQDMGKILPSSQVPDEIEPFGVVVKDSGFVGNAHEEEWRGKYERDEFGNMVYVDYIYEKIEDEYDISFVKIEETILNRRVSGTGEIGYYYENKVTLTEHRVPIYETYPVYDTYGNFIKNIESIKKKKVTFIERIPKISGSFDSSIPYIPRSQRPEWNLIGLLGQVHIKPNQRLNGDWIKMGLMKYKIV